MVMPVVTHKRAFCFYDCSDVLNGLDNVEDIMSGDKNDILRYAAKELERETDRAFASKVDPVTGQSWEPREHSYPWPLLNRTGTLRGLLGFSWGVTKRDKSPRVFVKVRDAVYMQRSFRGGRIDVGAKWGKSGQQHTDAITVVMSVHHGRHGSRTTAGFGFRRTRPRSGMPFTYQRRRKWSWGGGRGHGPASTGETPARPLWGFGSAAKSRVKRFAERKIATSYRAA